MKAILFDFDFTIADASEGIWEAANYALDKMGKLSIPKEECFKTIGLPLRKMYHKMTSDHNTERTEKFYQLFTKYADKHITQKTYLYKGTKKTLLELKHRKYYLGIVTTKFRYRTIEVLEKYNIVNVFDKIIGAEDVKNFKPNPEGVQKIIDETNIPSSNMIYIGDSITDAETAKRSNLIFVAVTTGTTTAKDFTSYKPFAIINSLSELIKIIEKWEKK